MWGASGLSCRRGGTGVLPATLTPQQRARRYGRASLDLIPTENPLTTANQHQRQTWTWMLWTSKWLVECLLFTLRWTLAWVCIQHCRHLPRGAGRRHPLQWPPCTAAWLHIKIRADVTENAKKHSESCLTVLTFLLEKEMGNTSLRSQKKTQS